MKIKDVFSIEYGVNLELNKLEILPSNSMDGVNFVSRTSNNNGVVARVRIIPDLKPNKAGTLSVAGGGSVLSTFLQEEPYYSGRDLYVLTPIKKMTKVEMLYYAHLISSNKYKYNYGRQANKTLGEITIPDEHPEWLNRFSLGYYNNLIETQNKSNLDLDISGWKNFSMGEIFKFSKGKRLTKEEMIDGNLNYIGAISDNNGVRQRIDSVKTHSGNKITVNYNGSVGEAFYQKQSFWASDDVNVLELIDKQLTVNIALFLCTVIKANKYRFGYGRKWTLEKMKDTTILLPVSKENKPDWDLMEKLIRSLPYSDRINS